MPIQTENLHFKIGSHSILKNINLNLVQQKMVCLLGPNGSGKSTLLRLVYKFLSPTAGQLWLKDQALANISNKQLSRTLAVVPQCLPQQTDFTVQQIVWLGRQPFKKPMANYNQQDSKIVQQALEHMGLTALQKRFYKELSVGEQQRTMIARALAQTPKVLVLDEPTQSLDIFHQLQLLTLLHSLPIGVVFALHDLNLASRYSDAVVLLKAGEVYAAGPPKTVLTKKNIQAVYKIKAELVYQQGWVRVVY